eukprot:g6771.t1
MLQGSGYSLIDFDAVMEAVAPPALAGEADGGASGVKRKSPDDDDKTAKRDSPSDDAHHVSTPALRAGNVIRLRDLSLETVVGIVSFLGLADRAMVARSCKSLLYVSRNPELWHAVRFADVQKADCCLVSPKALAFLKGLRDPSKVRELSLHWRSALGGIGCCLGLPESVGTKDFAEPFKGVCPNVESLTIGDRSGCRRLLLRGAGAQDMKNLRNFAKTMIACVPRLKRLQLREHRLGQHGAQLRLELLKSLKPASLTDFAYQDDDFRRAHAQSLFETQGETLKSFELGDMCCDEDVMRFVVAQLDTSRLEAVALGCPRGVTEFFDADGAVQTKPVPTDHRNDELVRFLQAATSLSSLTLSGGSSNRPVRYPSIPGYKRTTDAILSPAILAPHLSRTLRHLRLEDLTALTWTGLQAACNALTALEDIALSDCTDARSLFGCVNREEKTTSLVLSSATLRSLKIVTSGL